MVRLGIAGIGIIANDYIGLIADGRVPNVTLTALSTRNQEKMDALVDRFGLNVQTFTKYEDMLDSRCVDAVLICTPHAMHPSMCKEALRKGIHVLLEKPVGIYADEITECLEILNQNPHLVCGVMYNRRASKAYQYIRELVAQGQIGDLVRCSWLITNLYRTNAYYGTSAWRGNWETEGGGLLMTQASHQLDLMQWVCGLPSHVMARCSTVNRPIAVENEAELFLSYPNGAHGQFIASAHECPGTNLFEICGTKGRITIREDSEVEVLRMDMDEREFAKTCLNPFGKVPGKIEKLFFDDSDNKVQQAATIDNFARTILGQDKIQCPLEAGLGSLQIIHAAYISSWLGKEVEMPADEGLFRKMVNDLTQ